VGTGSGAIILSLAKINESWTGHATGIDISEAAIAVAQANRARLGLQNRVDLVVGDLLQPISGQVDLILANLPYLTPDQFEGNPELNAEPKVALVGGSDGLAIIRRLISDLSRILQPSGAMVLELDPGHATKAARMAADRFPYARIRVVRDLEERERFVIVERSNMKDES
jgi:release factor glutamine methyltransferase